MPCFIFKDLTQCGRVTPYGIDELHKALLSLIHRNRVPYICVRTYRLSFCQTIACRVFRTQPIHYDVIKWKHFPRYWPLVWGIHRWPVNYRHKGQWRGALMFSLIRACINGWLIARWVIWDAVPPIMTSLSCLNQCWFVVHCRSLGTNFGEILNKMQPFT